MPGAARLEAARILEDAKSEAKRLIDEAQATCKRARSDCEARLRESMAAAARSLDDRARELRRLAA
jgi:F0F1-type ATP synthase membrane subunit b/b'